MDWIQFGVQWLHVIFAVFWFGGQMFLDFVVMPTLRAMPPLVGRDVGRVLAPRIGRSMRIAGALVIILGVLRGTVWGPLPPGEDSLSFGSEYGMTWSISILLAIAIFAVGDGLIGRTARALYADETLWTPGADSKPQARLLALTGRLRTASIIQLVLFLAVFTCMILMRFGR